MDVTKWCSKCGLSKPLSEFHRSVISHDGRVGGCKSCRSFDSRRYVERRRRAEAEAEERAPFLKSEGVDLGD
jgi:hypothetical protein